MTTLITGTLLQTTCTTRDGLHALDLRLQQDCPDRMKPAQCVVHWAFGHGQAAQRRLERSLADLRVGAPVNVLAEVAAVVSGELHLLGAVTVYPAVDAHGLHRSAA